MTISSTLENIKNKMLRQESKFNQEKIEKEDQGIIKLQTCQANPKKCWSTFYNNCNISLLTSVGLHIFTIIYFSYNSFHVLKYDNVLKYIVYSNKMVYLNMLV